ncbi:hypothetical protein PIB30_067022 [Stylosanthes scabra]|uniref:Uncharacterized protein n=1 Tax=Stylosanthes scabra TaxID=79078 RepID=A0ABU6YNU7_9FABA|nr:hypothetical protein [Stylosanthes scabra]
MEADGGDHCCGYDGIRRWKERMAIDASKLFLSSNRGEEYEVKVPVVVDAATRRKKGKGLPSYDLPARCSVRR